MRGSVGGVGGQQIERSDVDRRGDSLDGLEGEVALTALETAHIGPVVAQYVSKGFLGDAPCGAVAAKVLADCPLELPFHKEEASGPLPLTLQTYR